jgi:hypothetical protein
MWSINHWNSCKWACRRRVFALDCKLKNLRQTFFLHLCLICICQPFKLCWSICIYYTLGVKFCNLKVRETFEKKKPKNKKKKTNIISVFSFKDRKSRPFIAARAIFRSQSYSIQQHEILLNDGLYHKVISSAEIEIMTFRIIKQIFHVVEVKLEKLLSTSTYTLSGWQRFSRVIFFSILPSTTWTIYSMF